MAEVGASRTRIQKRNPQIKTTEERPRKYYFTTQTDQAEIEEAEAGSESSATPQSDVGRLSEHALYPTLSNFLWANYGYLVAAELEGSDTKKELQILSALHGIGFILLDPKIPVESQVLIPARERTGIDWDTANRLVKENRDFRDL